MSKLVWDQAGERLYETGAKMGVLFPTGTDGSYSAGVAWNGLTQVTESPDGAEETALNADDIKYLSLFSKENFKGTIQAYTFPEEFAVLDGSAALATGVYVAQQARGTFGLAYRTSVGNDQQGDTFGYKIHLVYGAKVSPSEKAYETINETPAAITFSWAFVTVPVPVPGFKDSANIVIDSTKVDATKLAAFEDILYGSDGETPGDARLPLPTEVLSLLAAA